MADPTPPTSPTACIAKPSFPFGGSEREIGSGAGDLQAKLNQLGTSGQLMPGDTIVCPAGATYSPIVLPARADAGWIGIVTSGSLAADTRVSAAGAGQMFTIQSTTTNVNCLFGGAATQGWYLVGARFVHTGETVDLVYLEDTTINGELPGRVVFDRCLFQGSTTLNNRRGIQMICHNTRIINCAFLDFRDVNSDSQAIYMNRSTRNHIENNELQGCGENILMGDTTTGNGPPWAGSVNDTTIICNHMFKPYTWRRLLPNGTVSPTYDGIFAQCKNLFEIKWAKRVLLEGNVLEHNWPYQGDQPGQWAFIHAGVDGSSDLRIQNNRVLESTGGITFASHLEVGPAWKLARVALLNNEFYVGARVVLFNRGADDVHIEHNTGYPMTSGQFPLYGGAVGEELGSIVFTNHVVATRPLLIRRNVFGKATYGVFFDGSLEPNAAFATYWPGATLAENAHYGADAVPAVTGWTPYSSAAAAGISTTDGTLTSNSPLKLGQAGYFGTDGKDIGVDFPVLQAVCGEPQPQIPVANFTYSVDVGTRTVHFTDLSSNTPTQWAYSGPDGFSAIIANPIFTFPTSSDKLITLTASNALGSSAPYTAQITVPELPGFTHAQTTFGAYGGTNQATVPSLTVGHLVVVEVNRAAAASAFTIDSVDDTAGNIYTPRTAVGANHRLFSTVVTVGSASPVVITATISGTTPTSRLIASAWTPLLGPITFDAVVSSSGTGASPMNSGPLVAPAGAALIGYYDYDTVVPTVPAGWTSRAERFVADKLDPVAGTSYSFQPTFTGSQGWYAQLAIFVSGGGGPGPDTVAPTVPTGLDHDVPVATDRVRLTWLPAFDAVGVATYDVRRDAVVIATVATPEYLDTGLQSNTAHSYTVRAGDAVPNYSVYSAAHVVTTGTIESGTHLPPRYMRGFGPVRGTGPTDAIQTPDVGHGVQRSLTFELRLDDFGVLQCVFTKASETVQSLTERVMVTTDGKLHYQRQWSTALGDWTVPVPTLGVRIFVVIRMDTSTPASVPTIKFDNIQQTVTVVTQPTSGAAMQNTAGYLLGNFPGGGGGVLHGDLGRFAVFNFITTDLQDAALFAANDPLGIGVGAVQYIQLDGSSTEPDMVSPFAPSLITDTQTQDYEPPSLVTVVSAGRRMVGWVR